MFYMSINVVIYLRVSTQEQRKSGLGLDAQLDACKNYCDKMSLNVIGSFTEIISGKVDPKHRPIFMEALTIAQNRKASIMVSNQDRFSREVYHVSGYVNKYSFGSKTPKLICVDSPEATSMEQYLKAIISEEERKAIGIRTKNALSQLKKQGKELGKVGREVYHAKVGKILEGGMNRAKELLKENYSIPKIANILNKEGYRNSNDKEWSRTNLWKRLAVRREV